MSDFNNIKLEPHFKFTIFGKRNNGNPSENKKVGILNRGKDNKFINNTFQNLDVGIQDEGQNTTALGNKFE